MLMHDWYWARGKVGDYAVIASYITAEEAYGYDPITIFMLAKDGQIITDDTSKVTFATAGVSTDPVTGKPVADVTSYDFRDGDERYLVTFTREKTILQARFVDNMKPEERTLAERMGFDGAYMRFTGPLTLRHSPRAPSRPRRVKRRSGSSCTSATPGRPPSKCRTPGRLARVRPGPRQDGLHGDPGRVARRE